MFYLGVDGGGTKTTFVLINDRGQIISHTTKGSSYYIQIHFDNFQKVLAEGINEVCTRAGIKIHEINFAFFGLPAFGEIAKDIPIIEAIIKDILKNQRFKCGNDVEAGWAGSLACRPGINLVAGTGSIGFGRDSFGNTARAGGWGEFCGDEGSAYWLGKRLISLFGKEADGREAKTPIYDIVRNHFGISRDFDLISIVYDVLKLKRDEIAKLALLVFQAAGQGDPKALALYHEAAYENSLTVKSLLHQLHFDRGSDIPVSYSGGVFKAGEFILAPLKKFLDEEPVRLITPALLPVTGAALYAMKLNGQAVTEPLIEKLRKQEEMVGIR